MDAVIRAALGYFLLVFIVRVAGRRPGKQMNPFEFVLIFFMGGLALTFIVANDPSLTNAFTQIMTIGLAHYFLVILRQRSKFMSKLLDGTPLVLLAHGEWHEEVMRKMMVDPQDVMTAVRDKGIPSLDGVAYAVLERNGDISISPISEG